jgi:hypothetical protein
MLRNDEGHSDLKQAIVELHEPDGKVVRTEKTQGATKIGIWLSIDTQVPELRELPEDQYPFVVRRSVEMTEEPV